LLLLLLALAAAGAGAWWYAHRPQQAAGEVRYLTAKVERGPISAQVAASGTLNAVSSVTVGTAIAGLVKDIHADFNTPVKKGQVLARLDPATFELRVSQARADVNAADSALGIARSGVAAAQAEAARIGTALLEAQRDFERRKTLAEKNFVSPAELARARAVLERTHEQVKAVEAQVKSSETQAQGAAAVLGQRQSLLRQAQMDLDSTLIRAPVDGTVILRNIDAGQAIAPGRQTPVLFAIARDLREMQVEALVSAADAGRLRAGQPVSFAVDALPRRQFTGEVRETRTAPPAEQNIVRHTVLISASNPDLALLPGMKADVRVTLDTRPSALKAPNAALRFRPPGAPPASSRLWTLQEGELVAVDIVPGISDAASTEIVSGPIGEGADVVVGILK
jgi:HlyD family secretion protein